MNKLRLGPVIHEKPMRLSIDMPAPIYRELAAYGSLLAKETGQTKIEPEKLIVPMIEKFIKGDKAFKKLSRFKQT